MHAAVTPKSSPMLRWLKTGVLVLTVASCVASLSRNYADPDLWGHVQYGRDVLTRGLPAATTYAYRAEGHRWMEQPIRLRSNR